MKKIKQLTMLALMLAIGFASCSKYDDTGLQNKVADLERRVKTIEEWCNTTNGQISALQGLVSALEQNDFVVGVTPIMEGSKEIGYTVTFTKSKPITIMHGKDGAKGDKGDQGAAGKDGVTPIIGVKLDADGFYYWTVKIGDAEAEWITDASNNKIPTTGDKGDAGDDGHSPVLSVAEFEGALYWKLDGEWLENDHKKVPATGDKGDKGDTGAQGDAVFEKDGIDYTTDPDNVIFTLADGTKITLPKSLVITIGFDSYETFYCSDIDNRIALVLPMTLKESDYKAIMATVSNANGTGTDLQTRSAATQNVWGIKVTKPTFTDGILVAGSAKVILTLPQDATNSEALLKVTLIDSKGKEYSTSRVVAPKDNTKVTIDNTTGSLADKITEASIIKELTIIGSVSAEDFTFLCTNLTSMEMLDLSGTTITELPDFALAFDDPGNTILKTVVLPEKLTTIGQMAFSMCVGLKKVDLPNSVKTLGDWMFDGCASLEEVNIPNGVSVLPTKIFNDAGIKIVTIPSSVETIGNSAFSGCVNLQKVDLPNSVKTLGKWMFDGCTSLEEVIIPNSVKELPASAFYNAGIKRVTIPSSVETIGNYAFNLCSNLISITIPSTVTSLGNDVLKECANLESAEILADVDTLGNNFFMMSTKLQTVKLSTSIFVLNNNAFSGTGLTEYDIPDHITLIEAGAFSFNKQLHTITIPAGAKVTYNLFSGCKSLSKVTIAEGFTELGGDMFRDCKALKSIELPSTVTRIRDRAFQDCESLTSITCKATTPPELAEHNEPSMGNRNFHFSGISSSCILKISSESDYSAWIKYFAAINHL